MKRSNTLILAVALAALVPGISAIVPAGAADMVVKAPPPPLPPVLPSWAGFYFGANLGLGIGQNKFYDIYGPVPDYALDADSQTAGWLGGFQLGYNYQFNWLVLGLQGGFDWAGINRHFSCFSFGDQTCSADNEWIATLTGRVGAAVGRALWYVDGGPAWTRETVSNIAGTGACVPVGGGGTVCSAPGDLFLGSDIRAGWTVGGGVEYRLAPNWSMNIQYSYMQFGEHPITLVDGGTGIFPEDIKQSLQLITIGVNYWLTGPTIAAAPLGYASDAKLPGADDDDTDKTIRAFFVQDVAKDSVDEFVGGLFALSKDLDTSGPRVWIAGGAGWYQFPDVGGKIRGVYSTGDLMAGYAFEGNNYEINLLAGGSAENDILSAYDATDSVQGTAVGPKIRGDIYTNPTPQSVFVGEAEYTTAFQTYWTSASYGYDIFGKGFFVGPEVVAFGDERFAQWRVGGRVTALKFGRVEVDVSSGYAHDSSVGDGAYGHLEISTDF